MNKTPTIHQCKNILKCPVSTSKCGFLNNWLPCNDIKGRKEHIGCCYNCPYVDNNCYISKDQPFIVMLKKQIYKDLMKPSML